MNNLILIFSFCILGSLIANISNLIIIKNQPKEIFELIKISLYILPLQFLIGLAYSYYYSKGIIITSYVNLITFNYGFGIIISILINFFYFKKNLVFLDILSISFIILGISIYLLKFIKI